MRSFLFVGFICGKGVFLDGKFQGVRVFFLGFFSVVGIFWSFCFGIFLLLFLNFLKIFRYVILFDWLGFSKYFDRYLLSIRNFFCGRQGLVVIQ